MFKKPKIEEFFAVGATRAENLRNDLIGLLECFSGDETIIAETCRQVISGYAEKHRAYHNLSHISALLRLAESFRAQFEDLRSVRLAIWFHDAIYQPKSATNETESAKLAVEKLSQLNAPAATIRRVERMISATQRHDAAGLDADGRLFLDFDLSILGADAEIYRHYAAAIRREFSFVPWFLYRRSRRRILENFLRREHLYLTSQMREKYEAAARFNVENEIKALS